MHDSQNSGTQKIKLFLTVVLITLVVMVAFDTNVSIAAAFDDTLLAVNSPKLNITVNHSSVVSLEKIAMPEFGQKLGDSYETEAYCAGTWEKDPWGAYTLCVIPTNRYAIALEVANEGFVVFSCTTDEETNALFTSYSSYLSK